MRENLEDILNQEFNIEAEEIRQDIEDLEAKNPEFSELKVTDSMEQDFLSRLHEKEAAETDDELLLAQMSEEGREAYRLGKELLEKRSGKEKRPVRVRKKRTYLMVALVAIMVMAFGLTSFGGRTYIMDMVNRVLNGVNHVAMDSDEGERIYSESEIEDTYMEINDKLGISVVTPVYLPNGCKLEQVDINKEGQFAYLSYLCEREKWIQYYMYSNYGDQSISVYRDDKLVKKDEIIISDVPIQVSEYRNPENVTYYEAQFAYNQVNYRLLSSVNYEEFEKILKNLFFP